MGGDRKEAAERVVLLSKADPGAFAIYRDFIYRDYIFLNDDKNPVSSTALTLGLCYTLGDMLLDVNFEVGTGELDGAFAPHGHAVVINVA